MASYTVTSEPRAGVDIYTLCQDDAIAVAVAPAWGNNFFAFDAEQPMMEVIPFEELSQRPTSYGNPILFPFPNRIRDGVFTFHGQQYTVDPPRHGMVRDKPWQVVDSGASEQDGAWITCRIDATQYADQILKQFPFPFRFDVTYRLQERTLYMDSVAQNTGEHEMPLGFGIHPYFRRPTQGTLYAPARQYWELQDSLPTGRLLEATEAYDFRQPRDVTSLTLDDVFTDLIPDADGMVRCTLEDRQHGLQTVVAFRAEQFPHVVLYTTPAPREAICIEPYTCPTDAFNLQAKGIESNVIVLQPGETRRFEILISVFRTS